MNRGVAVSHNAIVIALNPDVVLQPDAVSVMVNFLNTHANVGMVGPKLKDADGQVIASCGEAPRLRDEICRKFLLHLIFPLLKFRRRKPAKPEAVAWVTGACFAVRRRVLDAVNGLDEAIFMYYEDVDLGLRINRAGWQVMYLPHAEGIHIRGRKFQTGIDADARGQRSVLCLFYCQTPGTMGRALAQAPASHRNDIANSALEWCIFTRPPPSPRGASAFAGLPVYTD